MAARTVYAIEALALALWIGALASFAFVFAPIAFRTVSDLNDFTTLIGEVLSKVGVFGIGCGAIALVAIVFSGELAQRSGVLRACLLLVMVGLSWFITWHVIPAMEATAGHLGVPVATLTPGDPRRLRYDALHRESTRLYAVVMILGIVTIVTGAVSRPPWTEAHALGKGPPVSSD